MTLFSTERLLSGLMMVHAGSILGMPGRILMSLMGVLVAMLSVTGIVMRALKRGARRHPRH